MMTLSKKQKKINSFHLQNDKDSVENENNRKKKCDYDAKRKSQSLTVDLRNRYIVVVTANTLTGMILKTSWKA